MAVPVLLGQVFILKVLFKIWMLYIRCAYMLVTLFTKLVRPATLAPMVQDLEPSFLRSIRNLVSGSKF
jgi:hypothetical protein